MGEAEGAATAKPSWRASCGYCGGDACHRSREKVLLKRREGSSSRPSNPTESLKFSIIVAAVISSVVPCHLAAVNHAEYEAECLRSAAAPERMGPLFSSPVTQDGMVDSHLTINVPPGGDTRTTCPSA